MGKISRIGAALAAALLVLAMAAGIAQGKADAVLTIDCTADVAENFDFTGRFKNIEILSEDTGGTFSVWYYTDAAWVQYTPDSTLGDSTYPFFLGRAWSRNVFDGGGSVRADQTRVVVTAEFSGSVTVVVR